MRGAPGTEMFFLTRGTVWRNMCTTFTHRRTRAFVCMPAHDECSESNSSDKEDDGDNNGGLFKDILIETVSF